MSIFDDLHKNITAVIDDFTEIMVESMVESKEEIIDLNLSQLLDGLTNEGTAIQPELEVLEYANAKKSQGGRAPLGTPDMFNEGDFQGGFYGEGYIGSNDESSGLFIDSKDSKTDKLQSKYSGLFGISPQNSSEMSEMVIENAKKKDNRWNY